jgi:hypothetical protein
MRVAEMVERNLDHLGHFLGRRPEVGPLFSRGNDGIYAIVARRDIEGRQFAEDPDLRRPDVELFLGFTQSRLDGALVLVHLSARKRDLSLMVDHLQSPPREDDMETIIPRVDEDEDTGSKTGVRGLLVSLVAAPMFGDHLELGYWAGLFFPEPQLKKPEVRIERIPVRHAA